MRGVSFDGIHSFNDWNIILNSVSVPPAEPKTNYVELPAGDGSIDLTEAIGEVRYNDRECEFVFTVFPFDNFEEKKRIISNAINGKKVKIVVDKDPDYYWTGRCSVNEYSTDKAINQIVIGAVVSPYKYKHEKTVVTVPPGENVSVLLPNSRRNVVPVIVTTEETKIVFNNGTYNMNAGTHKILDLQLKGAETEFVVTSTGTTTFTYQEGDL